MKECKLHHKILKGLPLDEREIRLLGDIIREELKFLLRNNILPTPKNYERWFNVFCYAFELGRLPSDSELIELYHSLYREESISDVKFDVGLAVEVLGKLVTEFHRLIQEQREYANRKEREISSMEGRVADGELTSIMLELLEHIRDIKSQNEKFLRKIEEQQNIIQDLKKKVKEAEAEANIDYLTNTFNRRSFERAIREAFEEYRKEGRLFSLIIIDLNDFKKINDNFGHISGDLVLGRVAQVLRQGLRARDILARWGGDEFAVLMPKTKKEDAIRVAERLKEAVEDMNIVLEGQNLKISFSYGVVESEEKYSSVEDMIREADELMYQHKRGKTS